MSFANFVVTHPILGFTPFTSNTWMSNGWQLLCAQTVCFFKLNRCWVFFILLYHCKLNLFKLLDSLSEKYKTWWAFSDISHTKWWTSKTINIIFKTIISCGRSSRPGTPSVLCCRWNINVDPHHFFFSYLSWRNSLNFWESFMSEQPSVFGSNTHSQVLLPIWAHTHILQEDTEKSCGSGKPSHSIRRGLCLIAGA